MQASSDDSRLHRRLVDSLYVEAMLLADEARSYFDDQGRAEREALAPMTRVVFSCESLKVTTRLMHVIAWLLTQRAVFAGEMRAHEALDPSRRLGDAPTTEAATMTVLPAQAGTLVTMSVDLHRRVARLDEARTGAAEAASPVRALQERLALAF